MLSAALLPIVAFLLGAGCIGGVLLAAFQPRLTGGSPLDRRLETVAASHAGVGRPGKASAEKPRKRSVEATLVEAEERQAAKMRRRYKPSLAMRLRQADIGWTPRHYYLLCVGVAAASFVAVVALVGPLPAAGLGLATGLLFPHLYVGFRRNRRLNRFQTLFPDAIDVIVRGIRSGVPLADCLKIVAAEASEPVKGEFKTLIEDQALGMPIGEAVQRLPDRVPVSEASFFAIVIAVQSRTGGNLSEALANLSSVLRERKRMLGKISALSAEAKASAGIIASLPVIVAAILYVTSPVYISILLTTLTGNIVLAACGIWMTLGVLVMRRMINFDF